MRVFGFEIPRRKALPRGLNSVEQERGWTPFFDVTPNGWLGAFQQDVRIDPYRVQSNWTVFACQTLIAGDIGKLKIDVVEFDDATGIYRKVKVSSFTPVLRKPNKFQTWQKFIESWILSKLSTGNAYVLKAYDNRNVVVGMYVLDPCKVKPLVSDSGDVYYELGEDNLAQVPKSTAERVVVPASDIIHDRMWCLFHPLVGLSPIFACGLSAIQGLEIQTNSARFFANMSRPSGILLAPGKISDDTAKNLKERWETNYRGDSVGKVAVLGDDLKYQPLNQNAVDSQLAEQLKLSGEMICSVYHVPGYKVGVGPMPGYQSAEILNQIYYDDCLQTLLECIEAELNEGLGLTAVPGHDYSAMFDLDGLLRMDSAALIESLNKSVAGGWLAPNEARAKRNLLPKTGGDSPMIQQQNYSLEAIAKRDAGPDPFGKATAPAANAAPTPPAEPTPSADQQAAFFAEVAKELEQLNAA